MYAGLKDIIHFRIDKRQFVVIPTFGFTNEIRERYIAFMWLCFFLSIKLCDKKVDADDWMDDPEDFEMEDDA